MYNSLIVTYNLIFINNMKIKSIITKTKIIEMKIHQNLIKQ